MLVVTLKTYFGAKAQHFFTKSTTIWASALVAVASFFLVFQFVGGKFDLHHTGLIATKLIAVSEGFSIHGQVFSQYGPLLTWSQVPFLALGLSPVMTLHIWAAIVISLTTFLLADLGRVAPSGWGLRQGLTVTGAVLWVLLNPTLTTGYLTAWSALLGGLLLVGALYLFALSQREAPRELMKSSAAPLLFASAVLIGLSPFARINVGLVAVAVLGVVIIAVPKEPPLSVLRTKSLLSAGLAFGLALPLFGLLATQSLAAYWEQSVLGPLKWAQLALEPTYWDTWAGLGQELGYLSPRILPLFYIMVAAMVLSSYFVSTGRVRLSRVSGIAVVVATVFLGLYLSGVIEIGLRWVRDPGTGFAGATAEFVPDFFYRLTMYFFVFAFLSLAALKLVLLVVAVARQRWRTTSSDAFDLLLWGLATAMLIQIVPTYDPLHVWWGLPIVVIAVMSLLDRYSPSIGRRRLQIAVLAVMILPAIALGTYQQLSQPLVNSNPNSLGAGTQVEPYMAQQIEEQLSVVRKLDSAPYPSPTYFMVRDGSLAAIDGTFHSEDFSVYVGWASRPSVPEIKDTPWKTLVIDSWVWEFLDYEGVERLASDLEASSRFCTGGGSGTIYCILVR